MEAWLSCLELTALDETVNLMGISSSLGIKPLVLLMYV